MTDSDSDCQNILSGVKPEPRRWNLFLDVDGVLLGKCDTHSAEVVRAKHVREFLEFALTNFECYWLTTHCQGIASAVVDLIRPYGADDVLGMLSKIRPTRFVTLKTEALFGDFFWLDDAPIAAEKAWLTEHGLLDRWIEVNTRERPDDLLRAMAILRERISSPL